MSPKEIKALREALVLTREQFGAVFGMHPQFVQMCEVIVNHASAREMELMALAKKALERSPEGLAGSIHLALQSGGPVFALYQLLKRAIEPDHVLGIGSAKEEKAQ